MAIYKYMFENRFVKCSLAQNGIMRNAGFMLLCLLIIVDSCSKKSSPTAEAKSPDAAQLFSKNCARCHGATGIEGRAPNLAKLDISKGEMLETITKGSGRMPAFEDNLSQKEIMAVADFVFTLRK